MSGERIRGPAATSPIEPIAAVARTVERLAAEAVAAGRPLILLAVDGVGVGVARETWRPTALRPLCTTFPSCSTTAWLSAFTGAGVETHLVPGVVYAVGDRVVDASAPAPRETVADVTTVFEWLATTGIDTVACLGRLGDHPDPWRRALVRGAQSRPTRRAGHRDPDLRIVAAAAIADVDETLAGGPAVVWAYVDIDSAVHAEGYSARVRAALGLLDAAAARWRSERGATVVAVSDHGLTAVHHDDGVRSRWRELEDPGLCRLPAGGAGRVRWLYARHGQRDELLERASAALAGVALVTTPAGLDHHGLLDLTAPLAARLGDVVAVGTDAAFPVPDAAARFEHGSITDEEILVPLAIWDV